MLLFWLHFVTDTKSSLWIKVRAGKGTATGIAMVTEVFWSLLSSLMNKNRRADQTKRGAICEIERPLPQ